MSITNRARDRDDHGRLRRDRRTPGTSFATPGYWVRIHMNRPRRHENKRLCDEVTRGKDPM